MRLESAFDWPVSDIHLFSIEARIINHAGKAGVIAAWPNFKASSFAKATRLSVLGIFPMAHASKP